MFVYARGWSRLLVFEISPFPGLDEVGPGGGIEDVHGRNLARIDGPVSDIPELKRGGLSAITRSRSHQYLSLCNVVIPPCYFDVVVWNLVVDEIACELFGRGPWMYDRGREINRIDHH